MSTTATIDLNTYPVFQNNQVLTSTQLNELGTYLDQQTRLTRTHLIGIGVVCGLIPNYDSVANKLTITAGTGVTSEGFLIDSGPCEFTQYRIYTLPPADNYTPFINQSSGLQVPLWELLRSDYVPQPGETIVPLDSNFLSGGTNPGNRKIVLMYLEQVDVSSKSCLGKSCDDLGLERTFTLRKLVINTSDLQSVVLVNTGPFDLTFVGKFDLPDLLSTRPIFSPSATNSKDYFNFSINFKNSAGSIFRRNISDPTDLLNVLSQTYTIFQPILNDTYNGVNPFQTSQIPNYNIWNEIMDGLNPLDGPSYFGIQYFYDFMRDLVLAYNEFRDAAFELMSGCCLGSGLFPMHLLLGEAIPVDPNKPSQYRDDFVGIPLTPEQRAAESTLIAYHIRMVLMIRMFDMNLIHNPSTTAPPVTRITPSFEKWGKLSMRSIPYYYKIDNVDPQLGKLERVWNYENIARDRQKNGEFAVVAYGNQSTNQSAPIDPIQTPLYFDLDQFNFLRIEGHLRKSFSDVMTDLNTKKASFNLPFNVVAVRLQGTSTPEEILQRCNFTDLRSEYVAYRNELVCMLNRFFGHFFVTIAGVSPVGPTGTTATGRVITGTNPNASDQPIAAVPGGGFTTATTALRPLPDFIQQLAADTQSPTFLGNSSVSFMPTVFALPGQTTTPFTPPLRYAPRTIANIKDDLVNNLNLLMSRLSLIINQLLPDQLDNFDYGADNSNIDQSFIGSYIEAVSLANKIKALFNEFSDQVWHSTKNTFRPETYHVFTNWLSEQFYFLNNLITDCKFRNMEAVFYELQYRIRYLQTNDPTLFSNFITRNPGIDHEAGVRLGGTFVLVYPGLPLNFQVKTKTQITAILSAIKTAQVTQSQLRAIRGRTPAQDAQLIAVESQLCNYYAAQVQEPLTSITLGGTALSFTPIQTIAIGENDVIADFALPYLSNCECECDDIPPPTSLDLGLPAISMPAFYEYNTGDYAFAKNVTAFTFGCTSPAQLVIDVRPNINYDTLVSKESYIRLKFVVNGDSQDAGVNINSSTNAVDRSVVNVINTAQGGTVMITFAASNYQVFTYTPPKNFLGLDSFEYIFELYSIINNNVQLRSNKAQVLVSVTNRCTGAISNPVGTAVNQGTTGIATG